MTLLQSMSMALLLSIAQVDLSAEQADTELGATLAAFGDGQAKLLYRGRLDEAIDQLIKHPAASDAGGMYYVGNMIWNHSPRRSLEMHEKANELRPDDYYIRFELALQYTRFEDCDRAIPVWKALRQEEEIPNRAAYIAAYCFVRTKDYNTALEILEESEVGRHHVGAEKLIYSVFGGPSSMETFDREYRAAASGSRSDLESALGRAFDWQWDWWNHSPNKHAVASIRRLMHKTWESESRERIEWDCLWEQLAGDAALTAGGVEACKTLLGDHPFPASSALGLLVISKLGTSLSKDVLMKHADGLMRRAKSKDGDFLALRVLAHLQAAIGDGPGLAESDTLGWKRYQDRRFRRSALLGSDSSAEGYSELLAQALKEDPNDALLVLLKAEIDHPDGNFPADRIAELICAETRSLDLSAINGLGRSHSQLRSLYAMLWGRLNPKG